MVIDAPTAAVPPPRKQTPIEPCQAFNMSNLFNHKGLEIPMDTSASSQPTSNPPQKIGTYIIEKTIGKGNFSFVKLAHHTVTKIKVAIKIIDKTKLNEENLRKAQREADILKTLHHPNIIKLYQVLESEKLLCIVTEYLPNGELYDYIAQRGPLSEQAARYKFLEILAAVDHCHRNNVVHRDLKAENMLLDHRMSIKLADFGFGTFQPNGPGSLLTTWCGSPPYAAPEIFKGEPYLGTTADIWSLGVILYVLVVGVLPFNAQEVSQLRKQVLEEHFRVPYWLSTSCEALLKTMLAKSPNKRPTINQIYRSKWLSEIDDPGAIPTPLSYDSTDSAGGNTQHFFGGESHLTGFRQRPRTSLVCSPTPTLAAEMKVGKLDNMVIQIMENLGIDRGHILESLGRCAYDHLTATYLLLGESLRANRLSLPQTLAPRPADIEALMRDSQHLRTPAITAPSQTMPSRSSYSSGGDLLFPAPDPRRGYFSVKDSPAAVIAIPQPPSSNGNHVFPSSHPHPGFFFGPTLPKVAEFTPSALRRTDASPSPPESPINLSYRSSTAASSTVAPPTQEQDCLEGDWLFYQSEGVGSPPQQPPAFLAGSGGGGEISAKHSVTGSGRSPFSPPSLTLNPVLATNTIFPSNTLPTESSDMSYCPPATRRISAPHHRYSATGPPRQPHLPPPFPHATCESHLFGKSVTDEHTSGLGSSVEADSHHSSFSHPAHSAAHFHLLENLGEDAGIDIPMAIPAARKNLFPHSPSPVLPPPPNMAAPRRKLGVTSRPAALAEQLHALQQLQQQTNNQSLQGQGGGGPSNMEF